MSNDMVTKGGCQGWLQQRTNLEKTLLSLSCIVTLTLLLLILFVTLHGNSGDSTIGNESECFSSECISTAGLILSKMNEKVDPCSNFYEYACGNYHKTPRHTNSVAQSSVDSVYLSIKNMLESNDSSKVENIDAMKSLYSSCMDFDGLHPVRGEYAGVLLQIVEANGLGTWSVLGYMSEDSGFGISDRLASLAMLGVPVAFKADVIPDTRVKGSYMLKLSPGGPLEAGRTATDILQDEDLKTYMLFTFLLIGSPNYLRAHDAVDAILSVDAFYATVDQDDSHTKCDSVDTLTPEESLSKLNSLIPEMNWNSLFSKIQKEAGVQRPFAVELHCKSKIRDYVTHLHDIYENKLDNYLGWRFFESFSKHISLAFQRKRSSVRHQPPPRWKECVKLLEKYAPQPLAHALTMDELQDGTQEQVEQLTFSIQTAAENLVSKTGWLNQDQKTRTLRQVQQAKVHLPYLKTINFSQSVEIPQVNKDGYTSAVIGLQRQSIIRKFKKLNPAPGLKENEGEFLLTSESSTSTPLAIYFDKLTEPYFRRHVSDWLNMGGLGTSLSREFVKYILSGVIDDGSSIENYNSVWDSWLKRSASSCFSDLFSNSLGVYSGEGNNAVLKELFLDASSLEMALEGAKTGAESRKSVLPGLKTKSDEQLFYIAYAQTLCQANGPNMDSVNIPIKERVNTILTNSRDFENAFSCSSSTTQPKCTVFI